VGFHASRPIVESNVTLSDHHWPVICVVTQEISRFSICIVDLACLFKSENVRLQLCSFYTLWNWSFAFGFKGLFCNKSNGRLPTLLLCSGLGLSIIYITLILCYFIASLVIPSEQFSLAEARKRFDESHAGKALVKGLGSVGFPAMSTPSMVVLGDAGSAFVSFNPSLSPSVDDKSLEEYESKTSRSVKYLIYPQTETLLNPSPPTTLYIGNARFTIDQSFWVSPSIADKVLRPASLTNRYNFAIYKRSIHFSYLAEKKSQGLLLLQR
jgi:hypothetical protein